MNYVYYIYNNVKYFYNSMNSATLSGAIDVIVIEQPDGTLLSTPFHVRFGKYGVFTYDNKYVDIEVNNQEIQLCMKLSENGVAYFLEKIGDEGDTTTADPINSSKRAMKRRKAPAVRSTSTEALRRDGSLPRPGLPQQPSTSAGLADGALSDSEIDYSNGLRDQMPDTEWKWGEIPKSTTKLKDTRSTEDTRGTGTEDTEKKSRWNWFIWSRHQQTNGDAAQPPVNNAAGGPERKEEEKGLYLQDLGGDPSKLEKYFGKRSGPMSISSNIDSGNEVSLGTSPCSPSTLSINEETLTAVGTATTLEAATTVTTATELEAATAVETATALETPEAVETATAVNVTDQPVEHQAETADSITLVATASTASSTNLQSQNDQPALSQSQQQQPDAVPTIRGRFDSGQSDTSTATELSLSDEESAVFVAGREKKIKYKRSLRLTSEQLKLLNLNYGSNDARFSITTKLQGTAWCSCHIYLLRWDDKLVISDIDGTITKSDVLGHVIPAIGGTWAHSGVADLYTRIKNNRYHMVYLSSRAIGQSHYTKNYLQSIAQGSQTLPDGPVLLSPTSVLMAFRKEVIERRPEEFKIACLTDLKSLFPAEVEQPFFAGFGNRETDVKSYQAVNIPLERILIIDPSGMLRRADKIGYVSDYATMAMDTVDYVFPPIRLNPNAAADPAVQNEYRYSEFNTWRNKPMNALVDAELEAYEARRKTMAAEEAAARLKQANAKKGGK